MFSSMELMLVVLVTLLVIGPAPARNNAHSRPMDRPFVAILHRDESRNRARNWHGRCKTAAPQRVGYGANETNRRRSKLHRAAADAGTASKPDSATATAIEVNKQVPSQSPAIDDTASQADDHSSKTTS